jgi:predicted RNA binding protein YcfA (HicA-like mRNA interferase family)
MQKEIVKLVRSYGYELVRQKKHLVFQHPTSGQVFTCAKSASDFRAMRNVERDLKRYARLQTA